MSGHLNINETESFYNDAEIIWPQEPWYQYANETISKTLHKYFNAQAQYILNAGSAGNDYGLPCKMHHVDIAEKKIANLANSTVASIENLPFEDSVFDGVACVGSVINYCDAVASISEIQRVLKPKGVLTLEFENRFGLEYVGKKSYGKTAEIVTCTYLGQAHKQWLYSYKYIKKLLKEYHFEILQTTGFHIISALVLGICSNEDFSAKFTNFDKLLRWLPFAKAHANNIIIVCRKVL